MSEEGPDWKTEEKAGETPSESLSPSESSSPAQSAVTVSDSAPETATGTQTATDPESLVPGPWSQKLWGPLLVAAAASLWATDALFRFPALQSLSPVTLVLAEHTIALLALLPWVFWRRHTVLDLNWKEWIAAIVTGAGGSALATVMFTASFKYVNPSVAILLQKLQPVLTVLLAFLILGDRPRLAFFAWAPLALLAGLVISFPELDFRFLVTDLEFNPHSRGVIYALGAAGIWAASTVAGKVLLKRIPSMRGTFWRFWFGWVALLGLQLFGEIETSWKSFTDFALLQTVGYMALGPGLGAVVFYYLGLKRTHASTATFVELVFPVAAVVLNTFFLDLPLLPVQVLAGALLLLSVTQISVKGH
ncbi:MAG: EamA family transporter [Bdellovibrionales bacterium]|nr:EamA family transporter [Bdellovibrionales bacterium]